MNTDWNKKILRKAIDDLPKYTAKPDSWLEIEIELDYQKKMKSTLRGLPSYRVPNKTWNVIEQKLNKTVVHEINVVDLHGKKRKKYLNLLRYAAVFTLLISMTVALNFFIKERKISYESVFIEPTKFDNFQNEQPINILKEMFKVKMEWSKDPIQLVIWNEFLDIEIAISELKKNMGDFEGQNMLMLLRDLENDKSEILKEMKEYI